MEQVLKKIDKKFRELTKQIGSTSAIQYITQQEYIIRENILPPIIGNQYFIWSKVNIRLLMKSTNYFSEDDKLKFLLYFSKLKDIFKENKAEGFSKITAMAYVMQTLIEQLQDRNAIELNDELINQFSSFRTNLENWMHTVSNRRKNTGKWGLSGDNMRELTNFYDMAEALLSTVTKGEWYMAYFTCYYRFLANRIGISMEKLT